MKEFSTKERVQVPYHHIDPGFINRRVCFSTFGKSFWEEFENRKREGNDHWTQLLNDHLLVDLSLAFCKAANVKSLGEVLTNVCEGTLFCSTEEIKGSDAVYESGRTTARINLPYEYSKELIIEFGTEHFVSSTTQSEVASGGILSLIGGIRRVSEEQIVIWPLIIGAPSFRHPSNEDFIVEQNRLDWYGWHWFEIFAEDIDEFSEIKKIDTPDQSEWTSAISEISEEQVKNAFCEILNEVSRKDWGGEQADHFSASIHLAGERATGAFLLKGPSVFREMTPDMLGRRADQIYRLACTPAQVLIVQHSHQIGEAVRATLRAFAVTPHNPRRYCLIDGKDTYKILRAYQKL